LGAKQLGEARAHNREAQFNVVIAEHDGNCDASGKQPAERIKQRPVACNDRVESRKCLRLIVDERSAACVGGYLFRQEIDEIAIDHELGASAAGPRASAKFGYETDQSVDVGVHAKPALTQFVRALAADMQVGDDEELSWPFRRIHCFSEASNRTAR